VQKQQPRAFPLDYAWTNAVNAVRQTCESREGEIGPQMQTLLRLGIERKFFKDRQHFIDRTSLSEHIVTSWLGRPSGYRESIFNSTRPAVLEFLKSLLPSQTPSAGITSNTSSALPTPPQ